MTATEDGKAEQLTDLAEAVAEMRTKLRQARARYHELFDLAPVGYAITDVHGTFREANRAMAALLGMEPRSLVGKPFSAFVTVDARHVLREALAAVAARPARRTWESKLESRDGRVRVVELTLSPAIAGSREPDDVRWVAVDVTQRVENERAIRDFAAELESRVRERTLDLESQRALLEAVIENIPAGVVVMDKGGNPLIANHEALRIVRAESPDGLRRERYWEAKVFDLDGEPVPPERWPMSRTLATGEIVRAERYEVVFGDRHRILELSTAPIITSSGEQTGGLSILRDVTTQERAERAERDFVTNAAHELQSPLASIVSAIEVLQAGAKDGPERDVFLRHIERESGRLARLVRALLVLARSQMGMEAPRDELVALRPFLDDVGGRLRLSSSVALHVDCPEGLALLTNRELLEQAVLNLAENAAKHTKSGTVALGARQLPDDVVEVLVSDTGTGIEARERGRVFERFYRADPNGGGGFGLGLAIVRAVANALDGEVELDSTVGSGTTIRLRLRHGATLVGR